MDARVRNLTVMSPSQCKAARALLGITQDQLAGRAKVGLSTVIDYERGRRAVSDEKVQDIQIALELSGIIFIDGDGVKLRKGRK
jgi:transcriptional regulator with XRE-family HTH domain